MIEIEEDSPAKKESMEDLKFDIVKILNSNKKEQIKEDDNVSKPFDELDRKWNINNKLTELFSEKIKDDNKLKRRYGIILIVMLGIQLIGLNVIFILQGCEILRFSEIAFDLFIAGSLAEIFGLVNIIVKYLFNDKLTEVFKIIIESNNKNK